jgi:hypothetical protein
MLQVLNGLWRQMLRRVVEVLQVLQVLWLEVLQVSLVPIDMYLGLLDEM